MSTLGFRTNHPHRFSNYFTIFRHIITDFPHLIVFAAMFCHSNSDVYVNAPYFWKFDASSIRGADGLHGRSSMEPSKGHHNVCVMCDWLCVCNALTDIWYYDPSRCLGYQISTSYRRQKDDIEICALPLGLGAGKGTRTPTTCVART